jgi:MOSC domain-containing protein YiiM
MSIIQGTICALFIAADKSNHIEVPSVRVIANGFEGDYHSEFARRRQILLMSRETLNALQLKPGDVFENAVVEGFDVMQLAQGQKLSLGTAVVEVTIPCQPCVRMDRIRPGLREAIQSRRGMFVKVITPGEVQVGDAVKPEPSLFPA